MPDDEVVGVARRHDRDNAHVGLSLAPACAVQQIPVARRGEDGVRCDILHFYAEPAVAAVDKQASILEDGFGFPVVKCPEIHEVAQQFGEVFVEPDEFFEVVHIVGVLAGGDVFCY